MPYYFPRLLAALWRKFCLFLALFFPRLTPCPCGGVSCSRTSNLLSLECLVFSIRALILPFPGTRDSSPACFFFFKSARIFRVITSPPSGFGANPLLDEGHSKENTSQTVTYSASISCYSERRTFVPLAEIPTSRFHPWGCVPVLRAGRWHFSPRTATCPRTVSSTLNVAASLLGSFWPSPSHVPLPEKD